MHGEITELAPECLEAVSGGTSAAIDPWGFNPAIDPNEEAPTN